MAAPAPSLAERFFIVHHEDFENGLNLNVLIPKLNAMEMLILEEMELLTLPRSSSQTKIQQFVQIMCRKGEKAPDLFLGCLRSAADHLPHSDLADKMEQWLREHFESPDTPGHVPSTIYTSTSQQPAHLLTGSQQSDPRQVAPPTVASTDSQHLTTLPGSTININIHIHNSLSQSHSNQEVTPEANVIPVVEDSTVSKGLKKPSIVYQSQEDILAKQSIESNQSVPDVSILAPNSLTPGSTQKKGSGKSPLPGASFMSGLFGGSQKKNRKVEEIETESGEAQPKKPRKESQANDIHDRSNKLSDQIPKLELLEDSPEREGPTKGPVREEDGSDSDSEVRSKVPRLTSDSQLTQGPVATSTQATGPRTPRKRTVSPIVSTTPFISTRKRRKNETELDTSKIPAMSFSEAADHNASLFSNTQATQDLLTPFTKLASSNRVAAPTSIFTTTGKRSKVNPQTEADILWLEEEDRGEGEHPLGTQFEDPPSGKRYKPVLSEDGFIKARVKPKLEAPRVGRFARMANSEYLRGDSPTSDSGGEGVASPDCQTQLHYQVEVVSLVTVGSGRRRVREDVNDVDGQNSQIKNFKKFRKVHNAGAGGVPRFLALTRYVPPSTSNMADWTIVDEPKPNARQSSEREEESQDSQNIFSLSKVRRKRTK